MTEGGMRGATIVGIAGKAALVPLSLPVIEEQPHKDVT